MSKFRLNVEDVSVESFETSSSETHERGTVRGLWSTMRYTCDPGGCMRTYGCDTAYCDESREIPCPTATCADGCTADCTWGPTWDQTCPATCVQAGGCYSGTPDCPN